MRGITPTSSNKTMTDRHPKDRFSHILFVSEDMDTWQYDGESKIKFVEKPISTHE